ncbi:MAG: ABC transporter ATP-binding protein [Candidatus Hadarchaeum sp.]|uniref:ABC transporter ATP-binding protein n=1 Tax=Candidatus Hadarchaeum sp. TaxID=2883567 RepID=UPI003170872F
MILLKVDNLHVHYGKSHVLQGVNLEIAEGEVAALLGRNGAGKTTFIKSIMGLVPPSRGNVYFKGENIRGLPPHEIAKKGIGYVPQGRQLFPKMTVLENLKTGAPKGDQVMFEYVFNLFPVLKDRLDQQAGTLSGGEQQALAIARAIVTKPELLLLDEPTTGLMPIFVKKLTHVIRELNSKGLSILLVEEKIPFALSVANRVYFMVKGKIESQLMACEIEHNKETVYRCLGITI